MTSTDLVVVLPGILGSTLKDRNGQLIWAPTAGALLRAITSFGDSITRYQLPADTGDDHPGDGVEPVALAPDVHAIPGIWTPVKGYDPLVTSLERFGFHQQATAADAQAGNLLLVPYDWRLSNRYNGKRLVDIVEPALQRWRAQGGRYADAQVVFVCHSMGGLVARWYIEKCGGAEVTRRLITLGTPYRGAVKSLEQLVNGPSSKLGRFAPGLTEFLRSLPSAYQLVPEYACIDHGGQLLKSTEMDVPELNRARLADGMRFHAELREAEAARPAHADMTLAIVGTRQPTWTTVRFTGGRAHPLDTIGNDNDYGDATVPLTGAIGAIAGVDQQLDTTRVRRVPDQHGNLQRNRAALDEIEESITAKPVTRRDHGDVALRVSTPDLVTAGEDLAVTADVDGGGRDAIKITVTGEHGERPVVRQPRLRGGHAEARFTGLPPGIHTIEVTGLSPGSPIRPVSADTLVWADPVA